MSELDKTIEELEQEVVAELDEANGLQEKSPDSTGGKADPMPRGPHFGRRPFCWLIFIWPQPRRERR